MRRALLLPLAAALAAQLACSQDDQTAKDVPTPPAAETDATAATPPPAPEGTTAGAPSEVAVPMKDGTGNTVGVVTIRPSGAGVSLDVALSGQTPGSHALHFHEKPTCEGPDFKSAGGHFNPEHKHHGTENPEGPHAGDMPNLEVGADGHARATIENPRVTLDSAAPNSLFANGGTALVIHAKQDDLKSDPAGNAGERVACGVIVPSGGAATPSTAPGGTTPEGGTPAPEGTTPAPGGTPPTEAPAH